MKTLSPSASNICDLAVGHFAERGYDASSLNEIAVLAGMRKASLYAHFANKDALFLQVFERALAHEHEHVEGCLRDEATSTQLTGLLYPQRLIARYEQSAHLRFLLRTAFLPPAELRAEVAAGFEGYLERLRSGFVTLLQQRHAWARADQALADEYGDAYLGIIDSLHVELFYASPATCARRTVALFRLLGDSMSLAAATPD